MIELYNGQGHVELVDHMGSDLSVVKAARVSINQGSKGEEADAKLIKFLMKHRHTSPFEHCTMTFKFKVPIFVARQHMRHRTWSFNEISRRYTSENIEVWVPDSIRRQSSSALQCSDGEMHAKYPLSLYEFAVSHSTGVYAAMIDAGVAREQARAVLPQGTMTEYFGTVSLHNLMHFLGLRNSDHAQPEIKVVAEALELIATDLYPVSMEAWHEQKNVIS